MRKLYKYNKIFIILIIILSNNNIFSQKKFTSVCIDAGHGGKDHGCNGDHSTEKEIVLSIALKLGKLIKEYDSNIKVYYTRLNDNFIELEERADIANRNNADLFISIHANSSTGTNANGTETFVLGLHKSEDQKNVAERENSVIDLETNNTTKSKNISADEIIARTIQLKTFLNQSIEFAGSIEKEFKSNNLNSRGVKQAGFVVLYKTTMPSVLIETGFLTNKKDNNYLKNSKNRDKVALSIFEAFKTYKIKQDEIYNKLKKNNDKNDQSDKNESNSNEGNKKSDVIFKIKFSSSTTDIELKSQNFKDLIDLSKDKVGNYYLYYSGNTYNYDEIKKTLNFVKSKGYKDAYIVAFHKGNKISVTKALKILKKNN